MLHAQRELSLLAILPKLLLPQHQIPRQHIHHLRTTQVHKLPLAQAHHRHTPLLRPCPRMLAVHSQYRPQPIRQPRHHRRAAPSSTSPASFPAIRRRLSTRRHLELRARDKLKDGSDAPLHLVHGGAVGVHVARLTRFAGLPGGAAAVRAVDAAAGRVVVVVVSAAAAAALARRGAERGAVAVVVVVAVFGVLVAAEAAAAGGGAAGFAVGWLGWGVLGCWGGVG